MKGKKLSGKSPIAKRKAKNAGEERGEKVNIGGQEPPFPSIPGAFDLFRHALKKGAKI